MLKGGEWVFTGDTLLAVTPSGGEVGRQKKKNSERAYKIMSDGPKSIFFSAKTQSSHKASKKELPFFFPAPELTTK